MRRDRLKINKAIGLKEIKEDLRGVLRDHHTQAKEELSITRDEIEAGATSLVPIASGLLQSSIQVTVSKSSRYPGIIATASAKNFRTGYDYAFIQEVNEAYKHDDGRQAHYLEQPFREAVDKFFERMGWK